MGVALVRSTDQIGRMHMYCRAFCMIRVFDVESTIGCWLHVECNWLRYGFNFCSDSSMLTGVSMLRVSYEPVSVTARPNKHRMSDAQQGSCALLMSTSEIAANTNGRCFHIRAHGTYQVGRMQSFV